MYSKTIHLFESINYFTDLVLSKFNLEFTALEEITQKANKNQKFKPLCQLHLFYIGRKMCYPCMSIQITRANPLHVLSNNYKTYIHGNSCDPFMNSPP